MNLQKIRFTRFGAMIVLVLGVGTVSDSVADDGVTVHRAGERDESKIKVHRAGESDEGEITVHRAGE